MNKDTSLTTVKIAWKQTRQTDDFLFGANIPSKSTCSFSDTHVEPHTYTHTHNCTSNLYTPAASLIVLTCTSLIHFLFALFVSRSVWVWSAEAFERSRELQPDTKGWFQSCLTALLLRCAQDVGLSVKRCLRGEWMAAALSWRHFAWDSLDTYRHYGCWTVNCR